jgi:hypothetical protein
MVLCRRRIVHLLFDPGIELAISHSADGFLAVEFLRLGLTNYLTCHCHTNVSNPGDVRIQHAFVKLALVDGRVQSDSSGIYLC